MKKSVFNEIQKLKDEKIYLDSRIKETIEECARVEAEYISMRADMQTKNVALAKQEDLQKIRLDKLDDSIEEYEMKVGVLNDDLKNLENSYKENMFELTKVKAEIKDVKLRSERELRSLKNDLIKTNATLQESQQVEQDLEKNHEETMNKTKREFGQKLKYLQDTFARRFQKAEDTYNKRVEPFLKRIQKLDEDIQEVEDKIMKKPQELKALRNKYARLLQKFPKATICS